MHKAQKDILGWVKSKLTAQYALKMEPPCSGQCLAREGSR